MANFNVDCSPLTGRIYTGKALNNGDWAANKQDVTNSAIAAVAKHLLHTNANIEFGDQGKKYKLKIETIG